MCFILNSQIIFRKLYNTIDYILNIFLLIFMSFKSIKIKNFLLKSSSFKNLYIFVKVDFLEQSGIHLLIIFTSMFQTSYLFIDYFHNF